MTGSSQISLRTATADDLDEVLAVFSAAMMFDASTDDLGRELFEPDRALVATDGDAIVGTTKAMSRDLSVPGAIVPAAHVTWVGVRSTHRRRGILRDLMARQLREVPEALAVLWASESAIYGRFGYGPAAWGWSYEVDLHRLGPDPVRVGPGELAELPAEDAGPLLAPVLATLQRQRAGVSGRSELRWRKQLQDKPEDRQGKTPRRIVVHRDDSGTLDGYALWRGKLSWGPSGPANEITLEELVATTPAAYRALWHHMLTIDLAAKLEYGHGAVDEPVQQLVANPHALNRRVGESLWVRITDVARALADRRYATPVDVVLEVTDDLIESNSGRFRLTADAEKAVCEPTTDPADLTVPIAQLGAVYLGGRTLAEFAATGRVTEHTPGALAATTTAFTWPLAPVAIEIF
jgi:predicted acetyltransferase